MLNKVYAKNDLRLDFDEMVCGSSLLLPLLHTCCQIKNPAGCRVFLTPSVMKAYSKSNQYFVEGPFDFFIYQVQIYTGFLQVTVSMSNWHKALSNGYILLSNRRTEDGRQRAVGSGQ